MRARSPPPGALVRHALVENFDRPVAKPRDLDESVQRRRIAAPLHSQRSHLPPNRVAFERNGLERRKARHVLGREYHSEASRGHVLQVQVVTAAVAEVARFLGEIRPLDLRGDVASGAFQQDGLADVVDADRRTVCERVCRREKRDVALLEQRPVVDAGRHVLHVPDHCGVDLPLKQEVDELLRCALAQLDAKSRDELCDLRDRIEDERRRDGGGEADLQWRDLLALELPGSATHRLCRNQCALQHRKDFLAKVGELRQLALAVDQLAAELLFELLHPLGQRGLRDIALLRCAREVECGRDGEEVANLMKLHGLFSVKLLLSMLTSLCTRRRDGPRRNHGAWMPLACTRWNGSVYWSGRTDTLSGASESRAGARRGGRSSLSRKSANARAAGFMVFPLTKSAFTSIEPKSQSGSTRTSCPASNSARALFSLDAAIPSPATALAVAPSLMLIARLLSTRTEVTRPSLRKAKVGEGCAGPMITEWCARSDGIVGVPRSRR